MDIFKPIWAIVAGAVILLLLGILIGMQIGPINPSALYGAAGVNPDCDPNLLSGNAPVGIVIADPLNLRTGPSLGFPVLTTLANCQKLSLEGRSGDNAWLEVRLPGSLGGWVFAEFVQTNVSVSSLEITGARGGPGPSAPSGSSGVWVAINYNQAAAFARGLPASTSVTAVLSPANATGKGVAVASGVTDSSGTITLIFTMPTTWADGSQAAEEDLLLVVSSADGSSVQAYLKYYTQ